MLICIRKQTNRLCSLKFRWYGKKIYHMLMPFDELDSLMKHYLNPNAYSNMCEIIDSIRAKVGEYLLTKKKLLFFSSVK